MTTKAYSYLRFSTPEQMKGDSFRRQTKLAEDYCRTHGLTLDTKTTYQDLGVSAYRGKNAETGRLGEFLEAVKAGIVPQGSVLLVESLDRISRQTARKAIRILEDIVEAGVDVVTLSDGRRYSEASLDSFDFLFAIIIFIRANEESLMKARRVRAAWDSKRAKAKEKPLTSRVPGWLTLNRTSGKFEVIEERADVVRLIFQWTVDGVGQQSIAKRLNDAGVPVFGKGEFWHRSYVAKTLSNPSVIGTLTPFINSHKDGKLVRTAQEPVEGYYPAIIPMDLWEAVRAMEGQRGGRKPLVKGDPNPLAGMVRCGLCGSSMTRVAKGSRSRPSFICTKAKVGVGCQYHSVKQEVIEDAIARNGSKIAAEYPDADAKVEAQYQALKASVEAVEAEIGAVVDLLISMPSEALRERLEKAEEAKADLVKQMEGLSVSPVPIPRERALDELADGQVTAKVMRTLFDHVTIDPHQGTVGLAWKNDGTTEVMFRWPKEK